MTTWHYEYVYVPSYQFQGKISYVHLGGSRGPHLCINPWGRRREGGREGGRGGGREEGRKEGREGGREGGRDGGKNRAGRRER